MVFSLVSLLMRIWEFVLSPYKTNKQVLLDMWEHKYQTLGTNKQVFYKRIVGVMVLG